MATGGVTVLVVDDEPSLRLLCRVNLELEHYRVLEAGTLEEARQLLDGEDIDVVILDVHVGEADGRDLLEELRARESGVKVAMLTGSADVTTGRFDAADAVIPKPFEPSELLTAVRELSRGSANVDSSA
jgi:DNA-binding response OmpR family regulator